MPSLLPPALWSPGSPCAPSSWLTPTCCPTQLRATVRMEGGAGPECTLLHEGLAGLEERNLPVTGTAQHSTAQQWLSPKKMPCKHFSNPEGETEHFQTPESTHNYPNRAS